MNEMNIGTCSLTVEIMCFLHFSVSFRRSIFIIYIYDAYLDCYICGKFNSNCSMT